MDAIYDQIVQQEKDVEKTNEKIALIHHNHDIVETMRKDGVDILEIVNFSLQNNVDLEKSDIDAFAVSDYPWSVLTQHLEINPITKNYGLLFFTFEHPIKSINDHSCRPEKLVKMTDPILYYYLLDANIKHHETHSIDLFNCYDQIIDPESIVLWRLLSKGMTFMPTHTALTKKFLRVFMNLAVNFPLFFHQHEGNEFKSRVKTELDYKPKLDGVIKKVFRHETLEFNQKYIHTKFIAYENMTFMGKINHINTIFIKHGRRFNFDYDTNFPEFAEFAEFAEFDDEFDIRKVRQKIIYLAYKFNVLDQQEKQMFVTKLREWTTDYDILRMILEYETELLQNYLFEHYPVNEWYNNNYTKKHIVINISVKFAQKIYQTSPELKNKLIFTILRSHDMTHKFLTGVSISEILPFVIPDITHNDITQVVQIILDDGVL